ncbi:DUF1638 domain-containing protein [Methanothrix sp.]|uniref:DUF1638 domain-containing protein n=1 Tax=Methanothrix sp. TaxID=90426 RepID=UPI003BB14343
MPVLSIVVCRMLEDELAHILSADEETRELILVDGIESIRLSEKLKSLGRPHILLSRPQIAGDLEQKSRISNHQQGLFSRLMASLRPPRRGESNLVVVVSPLRIGLHVSLERLQSAVYKEIRQLAAFSNGILLFYGRCGGSLADAKEDLFDLPCPLYFLGDEQGERIDDCIAAALGGNEIYSRTLAEHQDVALFMTPMWAANWKAMGQEGSGRSRKRDMQSMLKRSGLTKVARIDTGLALEKGFDENVEDFARQFGLKKIQLEGGTRVAERSYQQTKRQLMKCWAMRGDQDASCRS